MAASSASAAPPICDPTQDPDCGGGGPTTINGSRTLTVSKTGAGTVTGSGIDCGATCESTEAIQSSCDEFVCEEWSPATSTWNLTASYPLSGYQASWGGTACAPGPTCSVTLDGPEVGREASATVTVSWADVQAPSTPTFSPPAEVGPSGYNVSASAGDNSGAAPSYDWTVDNVAQANHTSTLSLAALAHGSHTVAVRARDAAGNVSATVTRTVAVDKQVSVTTVAPPAITNAVSVPLHFTYDSDVSASAVKCDVDGGTPGTCTSGWSGITAGTADGDHNLRVTVTDNVGNVASSTRTVKIDRTVPELAFTDGPSEGQQVVTRSVSITFSQSELNPGTTQCKLDSGAYAGCAPGTAVVLSDLANGQHTFSVRAVDAAGNERVITRAFAVQVTDPGGGGQPGGTTTTTPPPPPPAGGTGQTGGGTPGGGAPVATPFDPRISSVFEWQGRKTFFSSLAVRRLPATAKVLVRCKGKGCPAKRKTIKHDGGTVNLLKKLRRFKLRSGAALEVRIVSADGAIKRARWVARTGKRPKFTVSCAAPGGKFGSC